MEIPNVGGNHPTGAEQYQSPAVTAVRSSQTEPPKVPPTSLTIEPGSSVLASLLPFVSDHTRLLGSLNTLAADMFGGEAGFMARVGQESGDGLQIVARQGSVMAAPALPDKLRGSELFSPWTLHDSALIIDDLHDTEQTVASFLGAGGLRSLLAVPLSGATSRPEALLVLASRKPGAFSTLSGSRIDAFRHEVELLLGAASKFRGQEETTAAALDLSQHLWQTARREGENGVLPLLLDKALRFSGAAAGSIMVVERETGALQLRASHNLAAAGAAETQVPGGNHSGPGLIAVAKSGDAAFREFARQQGFGSYYGLPLCFADQQAEGLINLYWRKSPVELTTATQVSLARLAQDGAAILQYLRAQEDLESSRLVLGQFQQHKKLLVSLISHQLRTPLTSLKGFSQLMVRRASNGQPIGDARHAETLLSESNRLAIMLDNLLELSRLEGALLEIGRHPFDMAAFMDDLHNDPLIAMLIDNGSLKLQAPAQLPTPVGDPLRLRQALLGTLRRARLRSPESSRLLLAVQPRREDDSTALEVRISGAEDAADIGSGDPLGRIDLRNVIEHPSASQDELALYSAVLLMRAMGGDLLLRPGPAGEAEYVLTLPAQPGDQ